jgi:hypothetical protein
MMTYQGEVSSGIVDGAMPGGRLKMHEITSIHDARAEQAYRIVVAMCLPPLEPPA